MNQDIDTLSEIESMLLRMLEQAIEVTAVIGVVPTAEEALMCALAEVDRMMSRQMRLH